MKKWGKWLVLVLVCSMLLEGAALAAVSTPRAEAAATTVKELRFRVGGEQATINGVVFKTAKPYQVNGTTMVPAGMLRQAFGLNVTWTVANKEFTIATGNRKAKMTVGKTRALINRKDVIMAQAPVVKNGNLMVPLRSVAEMLNATLSTSSNGQTIVKWDAKERYADMSRVGSKSGNWSMNLPEDWYYVDKSDVGYVSFFQENRSSGSILLEIRDHSDYPGATVYDLMDHLMELNDDYAVIVNGLVNTKSTYPYAQINGVYYDDDGNITDLEITRMYQTKNNDNYVLSVLGVVPPNTYKRMLNSFRPAYIMSGIPVVLDDPNEITMREVNVKDMGFTFTVPVYWYVDENYGYAESQYGMQQVDMYVQDAKGLTAEEIAKKRYEYMSKTYISGSVKLLQERSYSLASGQTGMLQRLAIDEGRGAYTQYVLDVVENGLNFSVYLVDSFEESGESLMATTILKTIKLDASKAKGEFAAPSYLKDWNAVTKHNLSFLNASIELPASWEDQTEPEDEEYYFRLPFNDMVTIGKIEQASITDAKLYEDNYFKQNGYIFKNVLDETKTINGKQVRFLEYSYKEDEYDFEELMSVAFVQHGEDIYALYLYAYTTTYSDAIKQQLHKAVESLVIVK